MDGKLYFTVTLVVLAWVSVNTCRATSKGLPVVVNSTSTDTTASNTTSTNVTASNTTTSPNVTAAPPLTPNNTVTLLEVGGVNCFKMLKDNYYIRPLTFFYLLFRQIWPTQDVEPKNCVLMSQLSATQPQEHVTFSVPNRVVGKTLSLHWLERHPATLLQYYLRTQHWLASLPHSRMNIMHSDTWILWHHLH